MHLIDPVTLNVLLVLLALPVMALLGTLQTALPLTTLVACFFALGFLVISCRLRVIGPLGLLEFTARLFSVNDLDFLAFCLIGGCTFFGRLTV